MGIYEELPKDHNELTVYKIAERVNENVNFFQAKVDRKTKSQEEYYDAKTYVKEHY